MCGGDGEGGGGRGETMAVEKLFYRVAVERLRPEIAGATLQIIHSNGGIVSGADGDELIEFLPETSAEFSALHDPEWPVRL